MANGKLVNVGTPERPIFIPEKALKLNSPEGLEWWQMVAEGSVTLPDETLDKLLKEKDETTKED